MTNESNITRGAWWSGERVLPLAALPRHAASLRGVTARQMAALRTFKLSDGQSYTTLAEISRVTGRPEPDLRHPGRP